MSIACPQVKRLVLGDLGKVLRLLAGSPFEPLTNAPYLYLSIKLTFFLAVATSRHGSKLHALSISDGHI